MATNWEQRERAATSDIDKKPNDDEEGHEDRKSVALVEMTCFRAEHGELAVPIDRLHPSAVRASLVVK